MKLRLLLLVLLLFLATPARADGDAPLPGAVQNYFRPAAVEIGAHTYRRFGMRVYNASLWGKDKNWDANEPYALRLHYTRDVSKDTMVDTVIGDIRDQNVADEATLARWQATLNKDLPDVQENDELTGVCIPGKRSLLFYNGKQIASIDDQNLSKAFFNIWLGDQADEDMRNGLLGRNGE